MSSGANYPVLIAAAFDRRRGKHGNSIERPPEDRMSSNGSTALFHTNRYHAEAACEHCRGIVRHESWCITRDPIVYYAYEVVLDGNKLTLEDRLILHALGVGWEPQASQGKCRSKENCTSIS
jgi:hypothetical protein